MEAVSSLGKTHVSFYFLVGLCVFETWASFFLPESEQVFVREILACGRDSAMLPEKTGLGMCDLVEWMKMWSGPVVKEPS